MSSERSPDLKFEIGHVLFIDIVGYTRTRVRAYLRIHVTERQKTGVLQTTPRARVPVRFFHWPVTLTIAGARLH
jgi:hypothetical protein